MTSNQIIDFCLDNKNLSEKELNKQLVKLLNNESTVPYDHNKINLIEACGIDPEQGIGNNTLFQLKEKSRASEVVEQMENTLTKRELSYLLYRSMTDLMNL